MNPVSVYRCLCDENRLRILNLLIEGPLCVCHLVDILEIDQPKVSRHLKALKDTKLIVTERCYNWTICSITKAPNPVLEANLKCLQDLRSENPVYHEDLRRRSKAIGAISSSDCTELPARIRDLCSLPSLP
jgi:DNA-binding transcriptional ArsR family regulator